MAEEVRSTFSGAAMCTIVLGSDSMPISWCSLLSALMLICLRFVSLADLRFHNLTSSKCQSSALYIWITGLVAGYQLIV
ncbi:hypothetical protein DFS33DRAFT_1312821 [Desarmillaria ectypa]|nr:hypothetical protein DFS33DRAFT_1312821 [Desarmillaria ectypa]